MIRAGFFLVTHLGVLFVTFSRVVGDLHLQDQFGSRMEEAGIHVLFGSKLQTLLHSG